MRNRGRSTWEHKQVSSSDPLKPEFYSNMSDGRFRNQTRGVISMFKTTSSCVNVQLELGSSVPQPKNPGLSLIIYLAVCLGAAEGEGSEKHANGSQLALQTSEVYSTTNFITTPCPPSWWHLSGPQAGTRN